MKTLCAVLKSMKDEAAAGAWSNRLISNITALFERHEEMRKYLQPEQPPAGTLGAIGPEPLASGTADAAALEQTRQQMLDMQRQIYGREQELKLYREMLQDNTKTTGLKVGDIHIEQLGDRRFQYDWVAQQKNHEAKNLRVNANIWVIGNQDDVPITLSLDEIDAEVDDLPIQLKMKYFSINRGIMTLPEGFSPQQIRVTLRYPWTEKPQFDKKLPWIVEE